MINLYTLDSVSHTNAKLYTSDMTENHLHNLYGIKAGAEIYILNGSKVLMFKRSKDSPMFPGYWIGPGGHVDANEDFLKAAIREVFEETGVTVTADTVKLKAIAIHRRPNRNETWILPIFLTNIEKHQNVINSPEGDAEWIEKEELFKMKMVFPSALYYFEHVLNDRPGIMYTNLVWTEKGLEEESSVTLDVNY
jgi:8-oxo-dGTP diphosphatase